MTRIVVAKDEASLPILVVVRVHDARFGQAGIDVLPQVKLAAIGKQHQPADHPVSSRTMIDIDDDTLDEP